MNQVFAGLFAEGNTDIAFLQSIVQKTFEAVAFDCSGQLDIEILPIEIDKTDLGFTEQVIKASKKGFEDYGIQIICVHTDSDNPSAQNAYQNKIHPAIRMLENQSEDDCCKILAAIIPIQETEAWMLADKELLKQEIGTDKTDNDLGINRQPEDIANPKEIIEAAIRVARVEMTRRRRSHLSLADLYLPIGQSLELERLETLSSYRDFKKNIRDAFVQLNLLH